MHSYSSGNKTGTSSADARRSGVPAAASRNPFFRRRCHAPPQPSHGTDGRQRRPAAPWGSVLRGCPGRYGAGWLPCVGSLNGWLRLAAAGPPLRPTTAHAAPVNLISSGEFLEACFDKIDEYRQRDTSQLAAGLFIRFFKLATVSDV